MTLGGDNPAVWSTGETVWPVLGTSTPRRTQTDWRASIEKHPWQIKGFKRMT